MFVLMTAGMWVGMLGCANGKAVVGTVTQEVSRSKAGASVQYFSICYPDNCPERFDCSYVAYFQIGDCQYSVRYCRRERTHCQGYCMIAIERVDIISPPPCDQQDLRDVLDAAITAAVQATVGDQRYSNCFPSDGECNDMWRIARGACWYKSYQQMPPGVYAQWLPCGDGCCIAWVSVCNRAGEYVVAHYDDVIWQPCPTDCRGAEELCR